MSRLSVLTVDDEPHIHAGLDAIIDWREYGCTHAGYALDGAEALEFIERNRPDIIVTDIRMPGVDGLELIRRVRDIAGYAPAIILVTGYDEFEYARTALRYGVQDYLLKPIDEDELGRLLVAVRDRGARRSGQRGHDGGSDDATHDPLVVRSVARRLVLSQPTEETVVAACRLLAIDRDERLFYAAVVPVGVAPDAWSPVALSGALRETAYAASASRAFQETDLAIGCLLTRIGSDSERDGGLLRVKGLYHRLTELLDQPIAMVAGIPVVGANDAWRSRNSVRVATESRYLMGRPGFHVAGHQASDNGDATGRIPGDPVDTIVDAIERLDPAAARTALGSVCDTLTEGATATAALRNWLYALQAKLNRLIWELDGTVGSELGAIGRLPEQIELRPVSEIRRVIDAAIVAMVVQVEELRRLGRHSVVRLVKRRVDRAFAGQLSLADLADEFGMNAVYLGQMFKKVTGSSFKCYLRKARVAEARRLLESTDLRIPEVGVAVGYHDCDFFVEQFRRETDTTPAAYRTASAGRDAKS